MTKNTIALILVGATGIAGASVGLAACSSDSTNNPPPGADASQPDTSQPIPDGGVQDSGGDSAAPTCKHGKAPNLHPSSGDAGSLFCGFLADAGSGSADVYCNPKTQECCVGGTMGSAFADPVCAAQGTACSNGTGPHELDCEDPVDCQVAGAVCCLTGETPALDTDPGCGYYYAASHIATKCVLPDAGGACGASDIQLCTSDGECSGGKHCTPFKSIVFSLGFCM